MEQQQQKQKKGPRLSAYKSLTVDKNRHFIPENILVQKESDKNLNLEQETDREMSDKAM